MGSKALLNLWKKRTFLLHTGNLNRNFPYSSPYPSRLYQLFYPSLLYEYEKSEKGGENGKVEGKKKTKFC